MVLACLPIRNAIVQVPRFSPIIAFFSPTTMIIHTQPHVYRLPNYGHTLRLAPTHTHLTCVHVNHTCCLVQFFFFIDKKKFYPDLFSHRLNIITYLHATLLYLREISEKINRNAVCICVYIIGSVSSTAFRNMTIITFYSKDFLKKKECTIFIL